MANTTDRKHSAFKLWLVAAAALSVLAACTSKEQQLKERENTLTAFATSVVQHMYDRNPQTLRDSMNLLMREQLTEKVVNKLQASKDLPETEIDVLKIIDENQRKKASNKVEVDIVRPLGPIEKDEVQMKVTGKDIAMSDGKPGDDKVISVIVTCQLTPEMSGYPRATDLTVLASAKPAAPSAAKAPAGGGSKKRRRH
jgi:hypothetical protein